MSCLKFWDSTLLIKSYFGSTSQDELKKRINDTRQYLMSKKQDNNTGIDLDIVQEESLVDDSISIDKSGRKKSKVKSLLKIKDIEEAKND